MTAHTGEDRPLREGDDRTPLSLTAEQEAAVRRVGATTLVAAAAGSGKTRVLTERVVRAVTQPDPAAPPGEEAAPRATLGGVLAITFTEKAAGELRERIRRGLERSARPELARDVEQATIGTIHAFCAGLLRRHALAAGLDPRFTVLDERRARTLRAEAWSDALAAFLTAGGAPALDLLAAHGPDAVHDAITFVHDDLRSQTGTPRLPPVAPVDPAPAVAALRSAARAALADVRDAAGNGTMERATDALAGCGVLLDALAAGEVPFPADLEGLAVKAGNVRRLKEEPYQAYLEAHAACVQALTDAGAVADYLLLDDLLGRYAARYAAAKAQVGGLDFDDLELRARDLLREHPTVAARIRGRYACILVDEFQDTNPVQLELVQSLGGQDVFLVGDAFQSIYAFRHADVRVFRAVQEDLRETGGALDLAGNFRSDPRVITAINAAFTRLFDRSFVPMVGRGPAGRVPEDEPAVELLVTDGPAWADAEKAGAAPDLGTTLPREPVWRRAEARLLAQRLRDLLAADPDLLPGHIAILVRARNSMDVIQAALADVGLDTLVSGSRGYWSHPQVVDLVGWLRLLANPRDELTLWHVLGSPLVGASTDAMALLALAAAERGTKPWPLLCERFGPAAGADAGEPVSLDDPLQFLAAGDLTRLEALTALLSAERAALGRHGLAVLVGRIIRASGYDAHVLTLADGERRLAAIRKLQRLASAHEAAEGRDLRGFLDAIAEEQEAGDREAEAPIALTDDDAVQVMTIHAAKGLEFDVVAVFDTGRQENRDDLLLSVEARPPARAGLRVRTLGDTTSRKALAFAELQEEALEAARAEDRRLMYVAVTRARQRLLISGTLRRRASTTDTDSLTWLGPALDPELLDLRDDPDAPVRRVVEVTDAYGGTAVSVVLNRPVVAAGDGDEQSRTDGFATPEAAAGAIRPDMLAPRLARVRERADPAPAPAPLRPLPPPAAAERAVAAVSFTSLSEYRDCPACFRLIRVLGLPADAQPPHPDTEEGDAATAPVAGALDALARGRVVHTLLEELPTDATDGPSRVRAVELVTAEGGNADGDAVDDVLALVDGFLATQLRGRIAAARGVRVEEPFAFTVGDDLPVVHGVLDVIAVQDDGSALVVDYKTNRVEGLDVATVAQEEYGLQRDIYALAALRAGAPQVEVAYVFLERPDEPVSRVFTGADVPRLEAALRAVLEPVARGDHPVGPAPHGHRSTWCPGHS